MEDSKITGLPQASSVQGTDLLAIVNENETRKISVSDLFMQGSGLTGAITLQGSWDASTNTPDISTTTQIGSAWRVTTAGTTNLAGISDWKVGDLAVKTATDWMKIDNSDVSAVWGNIEGDILQQTDLQNALHNKANKVTVDTNGITQLMILKSDSAGNVEGSGIYIAKDVAEFKTITQYATEENVIVLLANDISFGYYNQGFIVNSGIRILTVLGNKIIQTYTDFNITSEGNLTINFLSPLEGGSGSSLVIKDLSSSGITIRILSMSAGGTLKFTGNGTVYLQYWAAPQGIESASTATIHVTDWYYAGSLSQDKILQLANNLSDLTSRQTALNNITDVANAVNEYVLTKDGSSGNAIWKPVLGNVSSVNTKTGDVILTQDDITDGTTYKQYSSVEQTKLAGIEAGAQENKIEKIKVNGTELPIASKEVDITIPVSASDIGAVPVSAVGVAGGIAELDENGHVLSSQLPSFVDDVLEYATLGEFPQVGESSKIYIAMDSNVTYRWSGSTYSEISPSIALGETSTTAYRGDKGKTAYDHSQISGANPHNTTIDQVIEASGSGINCSRPIIGNSGMFFQVTGANYYAKLGAGSVDIMTGSDRLWLCPTNSSIKNLDLAGTKITGLHNGEDSSDAINKSQLDAGLSSINSNVGNLQTNVTDIQSTLGSLQTNVNNKANLVSSPSQGDILTTASNGQPTDSGKKFNDNGTSSNDIWSAEKIATAINSGISANDAMVYKGVINASTNPNYPAADAGHFYKISAAGKIGGTSGLTVESGDSLLCTVDNTTSGNHATVGANWNIIQANIDGAIVSSDTSSVADNLVTEAGTTGKTIKDSGISKSSVQTAITNSHTHSNKTTLDAINQGVATTDSPTFAGLTDSGLTASQIVQTDANKKLQSVAPANAYNQAFETNTANIKMDGTVSVGSSNNIPRADHVHPSDTTKVSKAQNGSDFADRQTTINNLTNATSAQNYQVLKAISNVAQFVDNKVPIASFSVVSGKQCWNQDYLWSGSTYQESIKSGNDNGWNNSATGVYANPEIVPLNATIKEITLRLSRACVNASSVASTVNLNLNLVKMKSDGYLSKTAIIIPITTTANIMINNSMGNTFADLNITLTGLSISVAKGDLLAMQFNGQIGGNNNISAMDGVKISIAGVVTE